MDINLKVFLNKSNSGHPMNRNAFLPIENDLSLCHDAKVDHENEILEESRYMYLYQWYIFPKHRYIFLYPCYIVPSGVLYSLICCWYIGLNNNWILPYRPVISLSTSIRKHHNHRQGFSPCNESIQYQMGSTLSVSFLFIPLMPCSKYSTRYFFWPS